MTHPIIKTTGPQRAGSRLASQCIARQTGRSWLMSLNTTLTYLIIVLIQLPFFLEAVIELSFMNLSLLL